MELKFDNKISEKQVLSKANKNKSPFELNYNGSMLFMGDNFEVLSILLKYSSHPRCVQIGFIK